MRMGVLALQGAFREHIQALQSIGVATQEVRKPEQLAGLAGLIIPGGESTTIARIGHEYGLIEAIRAAARDGLPVWGTCAGMILLARTIGREPPQIGVMDIAVQRNAFGRQVDSFEVDLPMPAMAGEGAGEARPFHAIFIRAPVIESAGPGVAILARLPNGTIVAAREGKLLVTSFHPELTADTRWHRLFAGIC